MDDETRDDEILGDDELDDETIEDEDEEDPLAIPDENGDLPLDPNEESLGRFGLSDKEDEEEVL